MGLIKKIDVEEYFAARRAMRLGRKHRLSQPDETATKAAPGAANAPRPAGNLTPKQSSPSLPSKAIPIVSDSGRNRLLRPPRSRQE